MPRTRNVVWSYECDMRPCPSDESPLFRPAVLRVMQGDECNTGRTTVVHDQADADAVARQAGWTVGSRVTCPACLRSTRLAGLS